MAQTIYFRGTAAGLRQLLHQIPRVLAGKAADPAGVARGVQLRMNTALLSQVQQDFLVKSRGGTGRDGVRWKPLSPKTVAARARTRGEVTAFRTAKKKDPRTTALAFYGSRKVDVLRDTGRLLRSLTPGVEGQPSGNPDQVLRLGPGELILGSKCPYLERHQEGSKHTPARPVFPVRGKLPPAYLPAVLGAAARGVVALVVVLIQRGERP